MRDSNQISLKSWQKGNWCSDMLPPLSIDLPSIFNIGSRVLVTWPVVDLGSIQTLLDSGFDEDLAFFRDDSEMKIEDFNRKALDISIQTDTLVISQNILLTNLKKFKIIARKVLIVMVCIILILVFVTLSIYILSVLYRN